MSIYQKVKKIIISLDQWY